ncbi:MAG: hypothetical protein NT027_17390 [Proteobacteria bacterium]|nr:hypothetical protein [Pseudomonadota bacterium]
MKNLFLGVLVVLGTKFALMSPPAFSNVQMRIGGLEATSSNGTENASLPAYVDFPWVRSLSSGDSIFVRDRRIEVLLGSESYGAAYGFSILIPAQKSQSKDFEEFQLSIAQSVLESGSSSYLTLAKPFFEVSLGCSDDLSEAVSVKKISTYLSHSSETKLDFKKDYKEWCRIDISLTELSREERANAYQQMNLGLNLSKK